MGWNANAQWRQLYDEVSFYVCAHQDDWQLFMGANAYNDIRNFDEKNPNRNGRKVVIVYTTAGNLNDTDDAKSCDCRDALNQNQSHFPYWKVREQGSKNSLHLAACRMGGWGPIVPCPANRQVVVNGHLVTRYEYKNTVSYYMRLKAGHLNRWHTERAANAGTVDSSTVYTDWADFVNTLYYVFRNEIDSSVTDKKANFNFPDLDERNNPNDHTDHMVTARATYEATKLLGANMNKCFTSNLFVDYHTQNLPPNLSAPDAQNEAAITGAYCLSLLDGNAWPEWGTLYSDWNARSYFRTISSCDNPVQTNLMEQDSLATLHAKVFPSPADKVLKVQFNQPTKTLIKVRVLNVHGATVFDEETRLASDNTLLINTSAYPVGSYLLSLGTDGAKLVSTIFEVQH